MNEPLSYDLGELLPAVQDELYARLDATLSEKDRIAVRTALAKIAARAFSRGQVIQAESLKRVREQHPDMEIGDVEFEFPNFGAELYDQWGEQYGGAD